MSSAIDRLTKIEREASEFFERADPKWVEFFAEAADSGVQEWASWLNRQEVAFFETHCGGERTGHEVMAWSGFAHLYSSGLYSDPERMAEKLLEAFQLSLVSADVKAHATEAAAYFLH